MFYQLSAIDKNKLTPMDNELLQDLLKVVDASQTAIWIHNNDVTTRVAWQDQIKLTDEFDVGNELLTRGSAIAIKANDFGESSVHFRTIASRIGARGRCQQNDAIEVWAMPICDV